MTFFSLFNMLAFVFAGSLFGVLYLSLLMLSVQTLAKRNAVAMFILLAILRTVLLIIMLGFAVAFKIGPLALLATLAGFLMARFVLTRVNSTQKFEELLCR